MELGINSEPFRNGAIFKIISEISKWVFYAASRLQFANLKWWTFRIQFLCFRIDIFEL